MLKSAVNILKVLTTTVIIVLAGYYLFEGIRLLETGSLNYSHAYMLIAGAVTVLVLLPSSCSLSMLSNHKGLLCLLCLLGSAILQYITLRRLHTAGGHASAFLIPFWLASLALMALAGIIFDRKRYASDTGCLFQGFDWLIALALSLFSFYVRMASPMSMAVDEGIVFSEVLSIPLAPEATPWGLTATAYPLILHRAVLFIISLLSPLFDSFAVTKALVAGMGGISVGAWFLTVRVFTPRPIALSAATFLIFLGWHWLNSRFAYLYPYDLAFFSISALASIVALHYQRAGAAIIAGIVMGFSLLMQKFGVFLIPFIGLICLDYLCTAPRTERKRIVILGTLILVSAAFCYLPFLVANEWRLEIPRFSHARDTRPALLKQLGMTESQAFFEMWKDAFRQLQIRMNDIPRHMFRVHKPLLDPVFSGLFSIGLLSAIVRFARDRSSRIQIFGLLTFIAPMVVSFPLDSAGAQGMARRLLGVSFFAAWIAASGAVVLSSRIVGIKHIGKLCLCFALCSLMTNWFYLKTEYEKMPAMTWFFDYGGKRAALMTLAESLLRQDLPVMILDESASSIMAPAQYIRKIKVAVSLEALRQEITSTRGIWNAVIVPWESVMSPSSSMATQLSDLIPPHAWLSTSQDNHGIPMFAYAIVPPR
jgi:hypothetical protein